MRTSLRYENGVFHIETRKQRKRETSYVVSDEKRDKQGS